MVAAARVLKECPVGDVVVGGHSDDDTPDFSTLSPAKRAQVMVDLLKRNGVDGDRLEARAATATSSRSTRPTPRPRCSATSGARSVRRAARMLVLVRRGCRFPGAPLLRGRCGRGRPGPRARAAAGVLDHPDDPDPDTGRERGEHDMTWLLGQLWPFLLLSALLGAATVVVLGVRRESVEVWEDVPVAPPPAQPDVPEDATEEDAPAPTTVGTPVPVDADDPSTPFPVAAADGPAPWEAEELWSRPARLGAGGEPRRPKDEWTEAAENWRSWADEATGRGYAGVDDATSARDRDLFAADRDLFAADRDEEPATGDAAPGRPGTGRHHARGSGTRPCDRPCERTLPEVPLPSPRRTTSRSRCSPVWGRRTPRRSPTPARWRRRGAGTRRWTPWTTTR